MSPRFTGTREQIEEAEQIQASILPLIPEALEWAVKIGDSHRGNVQETTRLAVRLLEQLHAVTDAVFWIDHFRGTHMHIQQQNAALANAKAAQEAMAIEIFEEHLARNPREVAQRMWNEAFYCPEKVKELLDKNVGA